MHLKTGSLVWFIKKGFKYIVSQKNNIVIYEFINVTYFVLMDDPLLGDIRMDV
jgi:hypothetical protein